MPLFLQHTGVELTGSRELGTSVYPLPRAPAHTLGEFAAIRKLRLGVYPQLWGYCTHLASPCASKQTRGRCVALTGTPWRRTPGVYPERIRAIRNSSPLPVVMLYGTNAPRRTPKAFLHFAQHTLPFLATAPSSRNTPEAILRDLAKRGQVCGLAPKRPSHTSTSLVSLREPDAGVHPIRNAPAHIRRKAAKPCRMALHAYPAL